MVCTARAPGGVAGYFLSTSGNGVFGRSTSAHGIVGVSTFTNTVGVQGTNTLGYGVTGNGVTGVLGTGTSGDGVRGTSSSGYGVRGISNNATGVVGEGAYQGVYGKATNPTVFNTSIYGDDPANRCGTCWAGYFDFNVDVNGTLYANSKSFKIDSPIDPANKYLYHTSVESPDMLNLYRGHAILDAQGSAWVQMPDWFEALNMDFDYQLTAIGKAQPDLHIAEEMQGNRFRIAGGVPGAKVSWQVTGVRHDPYAEANRTPVEQEKSQQERGLYLHPELYNQPASKSISTLYEHPNAPQSEQPANTGHK